MKKQILPPFTSYHWIQFCTIPLCGTILDEKYFPQTKTSQRSVLLSFLLQGSAWTMQGFWRAVIRSLLVVMMGNALGDADTSLHNHKNCLSPRCCRHSKLFSSFYSFKNLPSFFTTLNNKDFEAIKSECVVYLCYNCEKAISHIVHRLEADALIIALQRLC